MRLSEVEFPFTEALAVQSLFMGFGIPPDDIYVAYSAPMLQSVARQGALQFVVNVAVIGDMSKEAFTAKWVPIAEAWNAAPIEERQALTERSNARCDAVMMLTAMKMRGFIFAVDR